MNRSMLCIALMLSMFAAQAASFNYQGTLQDNGKPAEGKYDLELTLYSAAAGGSVIGGPLMLNAVPVHNGSFSTDADFGPITKLGDTAWMSVKVRAAGSGDYVSLSARSPLSAAVTASSPSVCPGAWTLYGNAGNTAGMYLGTADAQPLTFEVNGAQAGQITVSSAGAYPQSANVVFGHANTLGTIPWGDTISGGESNSVTGSGAGDATIGGGTGNQVSGYLATVAGGYQNEASGTSATIGGGDVNKADGYEATVAGGGSNQATGSDSIVAGGSNNVAGGYLSAAMGDYAHVRTPADVGSGNSGDQGTFVWSDSTGSSSNQFTSTGPDQFLIRAGGGVGINGAPFYSNAELTINGSAKAGSGDDSADLLLIPRNAGAGYDLVADASGNFDIFRAIPSGVYGGLTLDRFGNLSVNSGNLTVASALTVGSLANSTSLFHGVIGININSVTSGREIDTDSGAYLSYSGVWTNASDRNLKTGFESIDPLHILSAVLALPVTRWHYKTEGDDVHHIGPMAQDFFSSFGLGDNDKAIGTVDEGGVALAAIQGLNRKLESENAQLRASLQQLGERLDRLEHAQEK